MTCLNFAGTGPAVSSCRRVIPSRKIALNSNGEGNYRTGKLLGGLGVDRTMSMNTVGERGPEKEIQNEGNKYKRECGILRMFMIYLLAVLFKTLVPFPTSPSNWKTLWIVSNRTQSMSVDLEIYTEVKIGLWYFSKMSMSFEISQIRFEIWRYSNVIM